MMMQDQLARRAPEWFQQATRFLLPNIRSKIIFPFLVLTLIVAVSGIYVVTSLVVSSIDDRLTNQLLEAGRVVSDGMARREIEHLESVRNIAFTIGLAQALQDGDQAQVASLVRPVAAVRGLECLIVTDARGRGMFHELRQSDGSFVDLELGSEEADISWLRMVRMLLESGDPDAAPRRGILFHEGEGRYYHFTAVPVESNDRVVGVVVVGTSLRTLLLRFKETSLADVTIYLDGGRAVASTFAFAEEQPVQVEALLDRLSIEPSLYDSAFSSENLVAGEGVDVRDRAYRLARGSLRVGSEGLGVFSVALPLDFVIQSNLTNRNTILLIFSILVVGVVFTGYVISQRITNPISRLVSTSQAVADGDLEQRTGIESTDEIGQLAETFDEMTGRLAERTRALEEALGRLRAILSSIGDGVILENLEGKLDPLNATAGALLEEMTDGFDLSILRDLSSSSSLAPVEDYEQPPGDQSSPWLVDRRRFEMGDKVISAHAAPVQTEDNKRLGTVLVMRDVTAEVAAERLKDNFITHVSHELRTPLTAIKGYSDLLLAGAGGVLEGGQRSFIETIGRNTDDLVVMVNELIDFSELEAKGRLGLVKRPTDLPELVEEVADEWRSRMEEKGLVFRVEIPAGLSPVDADARRLRWALINLMRNALQYTPSGGNVTLRLSERDETGWPGPVVILDVVDTGIGISVEDQQHLFTRFYRVTNMPQEDVRGLGVGLYLANAIVQSHGGEIRIVSEPGVGSTFSVVLPALSDEAE
jgi:signal transduction histidine kinase/HAMP domain-containing protein